MWDIRYWAAVLFALIALGSGISGLSRYRDSTDFSRSGEHITGVVVSSTDESVVVDLRDTANPRTVVVAREGPTLCEYNLNGKRVEQCGPTVVNPGLHLRVVASAGDPSYVRPADAVEGTDPLVPAAQIGVGATVLAAAGYLATSRTRRARG